MQLNRVTMTGADDSTDPEKLIPLTREFPFVEWGILVSSSADPDGKPRFPSRDWLINFVEVARKNELPVCVHVCGKWTRQICDGEWSGLMGRMYPLIEVAKRLQLNFHAFSHNLSPNFFEAAAVNAQIHDLQLIFQMDGVNDELLKKAHDLGIDAVPLFDKSGGAGILPSTWPASIEDTYCGYAGGLGPDNLDEELSRISGVADGSLVWVDMETKIRCADPVDEIPDVDKVFDLDAVRTCLEIAKPRIG